MWVNDRVPVAPGATMPSRPAPQASESQRDTRIGRCHGCDLGRQCLGRGGADRAAHPPGEVLEDLVRRAGLTRTRQQAVDLLNPALEVGDRALGLGEAERRQHHVGPGGRLVQEQVDGDR